jgi:hypothetical protein
MQIPAVRLGTSFVPLFYADESRKGYVEDDASNPWSSSLALRCAESRHVDDGNDQTHESISSSVGADAKGR